MPSTKIACPCCPSVPAYEASVFHTHLLKNHTDELFAQTVPAWSKLNSRAILHSTNPFHIVLQVKKAQTGDLKETTHQAYLCIGCGHSLLRTDANKAKFLQHCAGCDLFPAALTRLRDTYPLVQNTIVNTVPTIYEAANVAPVTGESTGELQQMKRHLQVENENLKKQLAESHKTSSMYKALATQMFVHAALQRKVIHSYHRTDIAYSFINAAEAFERQPTLENLNNPQLDNFFTDSDFARLGIKNIVPADLVENFKKFKLQVLEPVYGED